MENENTPIRLELPMLALRGLVLFPRMILHFEVGREKSIRALNEAMNQSQQIYLVAQRDVQTDDPEAEDFYDVGVVAEIRQILKSSGNSLKVLVEGLYRARTVSMFCQGPYWTAQVEEYPLKHPRIRNTLLKDALMRTIKELFEEYCYLTPRAPKEIVANVFSAEDPAYLVEYIAANLPLRLEEKQKLLEEDSLTRRLEELASILENENSIMTLEKDIYEKVKESIDQNQRDYYLREQMKVIADELGEGESVQDEADEYRERIEKLKLAGEAHEKLMKEADRLSKMPPNSQESSVIRNYLDVCLELPWNAKTRDRLDISRAQARLEKDHYGLAKVKERILELIAVRRLAPELKGQIVCLAGPPGVGKTSVAKSIAAAMGRKYVRVSLGGVRDESDIRGHRKTYIGAMPGRIINAMRLAGTRNPLILLDEVDKLGSDYKGDPSSALLEVLDAEQNNAFRDHYIELPFDLSDVLFVATANDVGNIPAPLLDRMELIELSSYTREEKFHIARRHLVSKQVRRHGLSSRTFRLADSAVYSLIDHYTREAGVRTLEREIASLCRKAAKKIAAGEAEKVSITAQNIGEYLGPKRFLPETVGKSDEVGLVNGLAWTSVGGEMLQVEVAVLEGSGKLELTGSLGDVMKESARTAMSFIRSVAKQYHIDPDFYKNRDIHIHFPEGATPKDGPSAGVTVCTALVSALTGNPVRREVAMTGEITLRGRVLAIGGLKEKTMAAYRAGIKTVIIPKENEPDLAKLDRAVADAIRFIPVERAEEVLKNALLVPCEGVPGRRRPAAAEALVPKVEKSREVKRVSQ